MPDALLKSGEVATSFDEEPGGRGRLVVRRKLWKPEVEPGLLFCNGWSRRAEHAVGGDSFNALTRTLMVSMARRHMTVGTQDFTFEETPGGFIDGWGNPEVVDEVAATTAWLQGTGAGEGNARSGKIVILAVSMGAATALNYAVSLGSAAQDTIGAIALISPAIDFEDIAGVPRDAFLRLSLYRSYGGTAGTFATQGVPHSPMRQRDAISALNIPIHIWHGSNDVIAYYGSTQEFIATTEGVTGTDIGHYGHSEIMEHIVMDDLATWLERRT